MLLLMSAIGAWAAGGALAPAAGAGGPPVGAARHEFAQPHMGTTFRIVLYSDDADAARRASDAAFARIAALNAAFTDYDPDSEVMQLCRRAGGAPVRVSDDLFDILRRCDDLYRRSDGAFDPTIAPVVRLWRRARRERKLPDPETLAEARARVGFDQVVLDPEAQTVHLTAPGLKLDLGGIAKGYASQAALEILRERGIPRALVSGAGDVAVGDPPPGRDGWRIALEPLGPKEADDDSGARVLVLRNCAVSTSGDAEQFVEIGGVRYAHIVDPRTGIGVVGRGGVTVVSPHGATSDALATAAFVLGPERGLALVDAIDGAAALFVRVGPDGPVAEPSRRFAGLTAAPGR